MDTHEAGFVMPCGRSNVHLLLVVALLFMGGLAMSPGTAADAPDGTIQVSGMVVSANTGTGLANATVNLTDRQASVDERRSTLRSAQTGADGSFNATLPYRSVVVTVNAEGYLDVPVAFTVPQGRDEGRLEIPLPEPLEPSVHLTGVVRERDGDPVPDARVRVTPNVTAPHPNLPRPSGEGVELADLPMMLPPGNNPDDGTRTNEQGRWNLSVTPGGAHVSASAEGYKEARRSLLLEPGERTVRLELGPSPARSLIVEGSLLDARTGRPVEDAQVRVHPGEPGPAFVERSNASGRFSIYAPADYGWLSAQAPSGSDYVDGAWFYEAHGSGSLEARLTLTARATLDPSPDRRVTIEGWVVGPYGLRPVPGALLEAVHVATRGEGCTVVDDGSFQLSGPPGLYRFNLTANPREPVTQTIRLDEERSRPIALRVIPPQGPTADGLSCPDAEPGSPASVGVQPASLGTFEPSSAREPGTLQPSASNTVPDRSLAWVVAVVCGLAVIVPPQRLR